MASTLPFSTPSEARAQRRTPTPRRRASPIERGTMWLVVTASGLGGILADVRPAGWRPADIALTAGFAALVSLAGAYARRWSWLATAAVALGAASGNVAVVCAAAAVVIAFIAVALNARSLGMGAAAAGLSVQALLRLPDFVAQGVPSLVAGVAVVPLLVSAYRFSPTRARRRVRRYGLYAGALAVVLIGLAGIAGLLVRARVEAGITAAQAGFEGVESGDRDVAVARLNQAAADFGDASDMLGSWWASPVRLVPLAGQQFAALATMADEGRTLAKQAAQAAGVIDYDELRVKGGAIDIGLLRQVQGPITDTANALERAHRHLNGVSVGWLVPPIRDRFDLLSREIARARPAAAVARDVVAVAPEMLGADAPQHYLVLFSTPSESLPLGGFIGNFAEVTADNGKLTLTRSGRGGELSDVSATRGRTLTPGDYLEPFGAYQVTRFFGNVSGSPNFPDVANVVGQLYPQAGGPQLDGVFYMDPYALAALLEFTGPVTLEGTKTKLTSKDAAHTLMVDQYIEFPKGERVDFLDEVTRVTFERLTTGDLPKPAKVTKVMNPMVEQGRLLGFSTHAAIESLFHELALDGAVSSRHGGDYLWVTQANANPNKMDAYLQRDVSYDASFLPDTGHVDGDLRIRLTNSAPAAGLPEDVIGNAHGQPPGTNHLLLDVYSSLGATAATIDDVPTNIDTVTRFGLFSHTIFVDVPPGGTVTVHMTLEGTIARTRQYQLTVVRQPTVNSDQIEVSIQGKQGWRVGEFPGFQLADDTGKATIGTGHVEILTAHLETG